MIDIFYFDRTVKKGKLKDLPKIKNKKILEGYFDKHLGNKVSLKCVLSDEQPIPKDSIPPVSQPEQQQNETQYEGEEEFINELLDTFQGQIHSEDN